MCRICDYDVRECRFVDHFVIKTLLELGKHNNVSISIHEHWARHTLQPVWILWPKEIIHQLTAYTHTHIHTRTRTCLIFINGLRCKRCYAICRRKQEERACHECWRRQIRTSYTRHTAHSSTQGENIRLNVQRRRPNAKSHSSTHGKFIGRLISYSHSCCIARAV